jgi:peptidyl-prolyl cis-trans isomerase C
MYGILFQGFLQANTGKLNMGKSYILLTLAIVFSILSGCGDAKSRTLAAVDGKTITVGDFEKRLAKMPAYYKALASQRKKDFLEDMIAEQLLYKEALRRGLNRDPEVKDLLNEAQRKILVAKLIGVEGGKKTGVAEADVKEFYEAHKDGFMTPLKLRASHIQVDTEAEAGEVSWKLKEGADFGQLAAQYSKDPSKERGGDIGYFAKGQLMPEIESACFKLEVGQVSDIVKTQLGYHIMKLTDKKEPHVVELSEVKGTIEKELKDKAQRESFDGLVKSLKSKARIKINEKLLEDEVK